MGVPDQKWETADAVLDASERAGYGRSRSRLQHWHQEGVISRPIVRNRAGVRGRETLYPEGTASQYVRALEIHLTVKLLDRVRWLLWFEGWPIETSLIRRRLSTFAHSLDDGIHKLFASNGQFSDQFLDYLQEVGTRDFDSPLLKAMRRRVGTDDFDRLIELMVLRQSGQELTSGDQAFLDRGVGDDAAHCERFLGGAPFKEGYEDDDWGLFEEFFKGRSLGEAIVALSDDDLLYTREVVKRLLAISSDVSSTLVALSQPWAGGLSFHPSFVKTFDNNNADQQTLMVAYLAVTFAKPSERRWSDLFLQIPAGWSEPEILRWKFFRRLGTEVSDFDFLLDAKRYRRALNDPKEKTKINSEILHVIANNRAEYERVAKEYREETGYEAMIPLDSGDIKEIKT